MPTTSAASAAKRSDSTAGTRGTLPTELISFVGRRGEIAAVKRLLGESRIVTLTGVGGVGKTRLAQRVAATVRRAFPDGLWFVDLTAVRDPGLLTRNIEDPEVLAHLVAIELGLRDQSARSRATVLVEYLGPRRALLVLDNCEHLLPACAVLTSMLLQACPQLRILATSREPLNIGGEATYLVPPLPTPDGATSADLTAFDSVALFVARAQATVAGFRINDRERAAVAEICRRVEGLPLAIELAAAWSRTLSPQQILDRSTNRFALLNEGNRSAPDRQQTLRACVDWSYELCSKPERILWERLSVFVGGCELDALEGVCTDDQLPRAEILDVVAGLVDKSIMTGERHGETVRYRMLETIREFGAERLQHSGEHADLRSGHRDWYLRLAERADADWVSRRQVDWFARLDREYANIQAAVNHCLAEPGQLEPGLRMLSALFHFYWWGRGWARQGRQLLAQALGQPCPPSVVRARALLTDASLALADGELDVGRQRVADARAIAELMAEPTIDAFICWISGCAAMYSGDLPGAIATFEEGLAVLPPGRDLQLRLDILLSYAIAAGLIGDEGRATACHEESLRITEPAGECFHRSYALWALGLLAARQGDHRRAAQLQRQSLLLRRGLRDLTGVGWSMESLAWAEEALGNHEGAATLLGGADGLWEIMGRPLRTYQHLWPYHEECERGAQKQLGAERFRGAFERGRAMSMDDVLAYALDEHAQRDQPPATSRAPAADSAGPVLTRREREVTALLAQGLSNKEIATRLAIAQRTVEAHVERILAKLGFTSRTQIAAWFARHGMS